jgi:hypothetical protein
MSCKYVLSDRDNKYSTTLSEYCDEGDRTDLLTQIKANREFCRKGTAISYDYFVQSLQIYTSIYIQDANGDIVGACAISLDNHIIIYGICVPKGTGIGTTLLNHVKSIGRLIGAKSISLSADQSVYEFYKKNGFIVESTETEPAWKYTEEGDSVQTYNIHYGMSYTFGGRRTKQHRKKRKKTKRF